MYLRIVHSYCTHPTNNLGNYLNFYTKKKLLKLTDTTSEVYSKQDKYLIITNILLKCYLLINCNIIILRD